MSRTTCPVWCRYAVMNTPGPTAEPLTPAHYHRRADRRRGGGVTEHGLPLLPARRWRGRPPSAGGRPRCPARARRGGARSPALVLGVAARVFLAAGADPARRPAADLDESLAVLEAGRPLRAAQGCRMRSTCAGASGRCAGSEKITWVFGSAWLSAHSPTASAAANTRAARIASTSRLRRYRRRQPALARR